MAFVTDCRKLTENRRDVWNTAAGNENSVCVQAKNAVGGEAFQVANSTCKQVKSSSNGKNLNHQTSSSQRRDKHGRTNRHTFLTYRWAWHHSKRCQHCSKLYTNIRRGDPTRDLCAWKDSHHISQGTLPPVELDLKPWEDAMICLEKRMQTVIFDPIIG